MKTSLFSYALQQRNMLSVEVISNIDRPTTPPPDYGTKKTMQPQTNLCCKKGKEPDKIHEVSTYTEVKLINN